jgi:hypothetical protein
MEDKKAGNDDGIRDIIVADIHTSYTNRLAKDITYNERIILAKKLTCMDNLKPYIHACAIYSCR